MSRRAKLATRHLMAIAALGAALQAGCAAAPDEETGGSLHEVVTFDGEKAIKYQLVDEDGVIQEESASPLSGCQPSWPSFWDTCRDYKEWKRDVYTCAFTRAISYGGCRKRNGTYGGLTYLETGPCYGDVSNCDGRIVCQNSCP
jgi:hypothetical protein